MTRTPAKSSLSEARNKVSYQFFKDLFEADLERLQPHRKKFRGFYLYAVDGDDLNLPRSKDLLEKGYKGFPYSKEFETHYPKMYTVFAYDILNGLVKKFIPSNTSKESQSAIEMVKKFEQKSIVIYDRLFAGYPLMNMHIKAGNHFLIRMKCDGQRVPKPLQTFLKSDVNDAEVTWYPHKKTKDPIRVRIVKVIHPKTKKVLIFSTNLSVDEFSREEISQLYQKRWTIETSFKDLTHTMKLGQWHSKNENGILQEIYALLWFINNVKMQLALLQEPPKDFLEHQSYYKSNLKFCVGLVLENLNLIIKKKWIDLRKLLIFWIKRTREKRTHHSRSYPRVVKEKQSKFPVHSSIPRS